jgi:hypothetical protein
VLRYGAPVQLLRGALLAALATLLTATGHVVAGGTLTDLTPFAVLVPLLATVFITLAERCRGTVAMLAALGAGQVCLHYLLVLLTAHDHGPAHAAVPAGPMIAGHAVATLVTAAVVARADAAVTALVTAVRRILPRRLRLPAVHVPLPTRPVPDADVPLLASVALTAAHARRGPPSHR